LGGAAGTKKKKSEKFPRNKKVKKRQGLSIRQKGSLRQDQREPSREKKKKKKKKKKNRMSKRTRRGGKMSWARWRLAEAGKVLYGGKFWKNPPWERGQMRVIRTNRKGRLVDPVETSGRPQQTSRRERGECGGRVLLTNGGELPVGRLKRQSWRVRLCSGRNKHLEKREKGPNKLQAKKRGRST